MQKDKMIIIGDIVDLISYDFPLQQGGGASSVEEMFDYPLQSSAGSDHEGDGFPPTMSGAESDHEGDGFPPTMSGAGSDHESDGFPPAMNGAESDKEGIEYGIPYRTTIGSILKGGLLSAMVPGSGGIPMKIHLNDELALAFYRESGRYTTRVKVVNLEIRDDSRFMHLALLAEPEKDQRRKYYRLPVSLNVILCEYINHIEEDITMREELAEAVALEIAGTKDISITGVALITKHGYVHGDKYILKLFFENKPREKATPFIICAEVIRSIPGRQNNSFQVGMRFFGQTQSMSEYLARYVLKQQQIQIMQRRLVEGV